jgi:hypothetical protein
MVLFELFLMPQMKIFLVNLVSILGPVWLEALCHSLPCSFANFLTLGEQILSHKNLA